MKYNLAPSNYNDGKTSVLNNLRLMKAAMREMGAEHVAFHQHFADVKKRLEDMKKAYGGNELDVEVVHATALEAYLSDGNRPKVMAFGRLELEKAWKEYRQEEEKLGDLQKETAKLLEILSGGRVGGYD